MTDVKGKALDELLHRLRNGIYSERVAAAVALGDAGDLQAIPFLRRALKRLRPPQPSTDAVGEMSTQQKKGSDRLVHDPDVALRMAIIDAITKLLLGVGSSQEPAGRRLKPTVSQEIDFADGSRLKVKLEAPLGADEDLASVIYFEQLLPLLSKIGGQPGEVQH